ncbi:MAG: GDSL-type esterase/lipase family protein [Planctomycetota bacterium]|nr:GDSL-type esterase/lipase family protein [Planctomycetota bacterium]
MIALGTMELVARCFLSDQGNQRFQQINQIVVFLGTKQDDLMLNFDSQRFWKLKPNIEIHDAENTFWQGTVSNSRGFRCPEFAIPKSQGVLRIVCFGDSSTFGIGAPMEDTWPSVLQNMLDQATPLEFDRQEQRFEVINAGVPGYTSYQGLQHMRQELDRLQPDLVMASYANNDFWHWDQQTDAQHAADFSETGLASLLRTSRVAQLMDLALIRLRRTAHDTNQTASPNQHWAKAATFSYFDPVNEWTRRVPLESFRENLSQMVDLCAARRVPLIMMKWPDQPQAAGLWSPRIAYQEVIDQIAIDRGLHVADVVKLFQENRSWSVGTYVPNDIVHVNRDGNTLAADAAHQAICSALSESHLLTN